MMRHTLTRKAVDVSLRVGLAPWATAGRLTRRHRERSSLELAVERFDASARELAGRVLSDDELIDDAARRKAATQARSTARNLHQSADQHQSEAERVAHERREQAEDLRERGEERAEKRRESAAQTEAKRKQEADATRRKKKRAVKKTAQKRKEAIAKQEREARLEALEEREEALEAKEDALTAADEAERLRTAAEDKKANRR